MAVRSLRDLLDQPIISRDDVQLGEVADAYLEPVEQRVVKLSVDWLPNRDQVSGPDLDLPLAQVTNFDPHQLVVASEVGETAGLDFSPYDDGDLVAGGQILDREVVTKSGEPIGLLADVYFDDSDGAITGYEVEQPETGMPSRIIAPTPEIEFSGDRVIMPDRFQLVEDRYGDEDEDMREEQDLVFESGNRDRKVEDPSLESEEEAPEPSPFLD